MFEVQNYVESAACLNCEKTTECLLVNCQRGTFAGPLCPKCLVRESKKRSRNTPPGNPTGQTPESERPMP